jgi:hypothetical protein
VQLDRDAEAGVREVEVRRPTVPPAHLVLARRFRHPVAAEQPEKPPLEH